MNMSLVLMVLLVMINVGAILFLLIAHESKPRVQSSAAPVEEIEPHLQALIEEVETVPAPVARPAGEVGLEAALRRWRQSGKNASQAAESCRHEHTA